MEKILLSLGSNLGDREKYIDDAIILLANSGVNIIKKSRNLCNKAILKDGAPKEWDVEFMNCVVIGKTIMTPEALLKTCKEIERKLGRDLSSPIWSPREIDIDILQYGEARIESDELTIPHKELKNRIFLQDLFREISTDKLRF